MESNHFSYFRVKNFKRFKDLEVKDIGQFNLVLGDNNVGKTSLLEALMFDGDIDTFLMSLSKRLEKRNIGGELTGGVWEFYINNDIKVNSTDNLILTDFLFGLQGGGNLQPHFHYSFHKVTKTLKDVAGGYRIGKAFEGRPVEENEIKNPKGFSGPIDYFEPFISNLDRHDLGLPKQYSKLVNDSPKSFKKEFINSLKIIDSSIQDLNDDILSTNRHLLSVESENFDSRTLLAMYGDGTISLFRILLFLHLNRNKKVMFDEIDAGVYFGRMKNYWAVILKLANDNNVQIFATTHNQECIKAYNEALDDLGEIYQSKARAMSLVENPKSYEISSVTYSFEEFQHSLMAGNEIR